MKHKTFVATLPAETRTRLNRKSASLGIVHLCLHLVTIFVLGAAVWWVPVIWPFFVVALGIVLMGLFALEHEATHKTPFVNITVNEWVGRFCGLVLILPFEWFRYFHLAHHKYTNIPGKDPELEAGAKPDTWRDYIWHVSGIPYWVGTLRGLVTICRGGALGDYVPQSARPRIIREARMLAVIYALIFLSLLVSPIAFYLWILPIIVGQPFLRLYLLAEHGRCPFVADMFQNTRTTFTNRIVRFLAWNMPYHAEHHTMPTVPFHNLPDLHVETQAYLAQTENGYATFHRSYIGTF